MYAPSIHVLLLIYNNVNTHDDLSFTLGKGGGSSLSTGAMGIEQNLMPVTATCIHDNLTHN